MAYVYHGGEQSHIRIHDCLDSNLPTYSVFAQSEVFFSWSDAVFQPLLGGIPRGCLPSETNLYVLPYRFMSPFGAFVFCELFGKIVALVGMVLLLRRHLTPNAPNIIIFGVALSFALLPFYPCMGLNVAGQPLLFYALLNLRDRDSAVHNWLIVGLFPFLSSLVLVGFFLIPGLAACLIYERLIRRKVVMALLLAWLLLTLGYAIAEYRLIYQLFGARNFVSNRVEFTWEGSTLINTIKYTVLHFAYGERQTVSAQFPVILLACFLTTSLGLILRNRNSHRPTFEGDQCGAVPGVLPREVIAVMTLVLCCGMLAMCFALYDFSTVRRMIEATGIPTLRMLQWKRVFWLEPLCWSMAFAFAMAFLARQSRVGLGGSVLLILCQIFVVLQTDWSLNYDQEESASQTSGFRLSCSEMFSPPLFNEIRDYIGKPQSEYRVVSLGMYPSIALYNGFYTADGTMQNYPLEYKHAFRKVIAKELEKAPLLQKYFDTYGARCYLFVQELGKNYLYTKKHSKRSIKHLDIDPVALQRLGVRYIFSAVKIGNNEQMGLKLERVFERDDSPWQIFLYSLEAVKTPGAKS